MVPKQELGNQKSSLDYSPISPFPPFKDSVPSRLCGLILPEVFSKSQDPGGRLMESGAEGPDAVQVIPPEMDPVGE
jgi:hypothetical protein